MGKVMKRSRQVTVTLDDDALALLEGHARWLGASTASLAAFYLTVAIGQHEKRLRPLRATAEGEAKAATSPARTASSPARRR